MTIETKKHLAADHYTVRSVSDILFKLENTEKELRYSQNLLVGLNATLGYRVKVYGSPGSDLMTRISDARDSIIALDREVNLLKWILSINQ